MRSIVAASFTAGSARRWTTPVAAYGGRGMCGGTVRIGPTRPGRTRPPDALWQRLYLRPLPHQHGSLDLRTGLTTASSVRRRDALA